MLNRRGFERALAAGCDEIGMVVVASDTFNQRNQGVTTAESVAAWREMARAAKDAGLRAQVTLSAAFGCPFEGEVLPARVVALAREVAEGEPVEIAIADSIGAGVPAQVTDLVGRLREALPGHAAALPLPQYAEHRHRECLGRGRSGRRNAGREHRRHRRLPVRAGSDG